MKSRAEIWYRPGCGGCGIAPSISSGFYPKLHSVEAMVDQLGGEQALLPRWGEVEG